MSSKRALSRKRKPKKQADIQLISKQIKNFNPCKIEAPCPTSADGRELFHCLPEWDFLRRHQVRFELLHSIFKNSLLLIQNICLFHEFIKKPVDL